MNGRELDRLASPSVRERLVEQLPLRAGISRGAQIDPLLSGHKLKKEVVAEFAGIAADREVEAVRRGKRSQHN